MTQSNAPKKQTKALGRGLDALFGAEKASLVEERQDTLSSSKQDSDSVPQGGSRDTKRVNIAQLRPGKNQPRRFFSEEDLKELSLSIQNHGLLQPILVRPVVDDVEDFEIIAGERRWRAAQKAGLHDVPVIIREMSDLSALEIGLVENLQRSDLSAIEEAEAYQRLMDEFGHSQDALAKALGKSRPYIANILRLLNLPETIRKQVHQGDLSPGHARTLLAAKDPESLAKRILKEKLSVRSLEAIIQEEKSGSSNKKQAARGKKTPITEAQASKNYSKDANIRALEKDLSQELGLSVEIRHLANGRGEMVLQYNSLDQLDEILEKITHQRL